MVTARVPAKINVYLGVGAARDDGFHELATLFCAVSLYDEVSVEAVDGDHNAVSVSVQGPQVAGVPADDRNLAVRAVRLLAEEAPHATSARVRLHKTIPVAGGMAGGSADAAGALLAAATLWEADLDTLMPLAAKLGSDVPFALAGGVAIGRGRGEHLTPVEAPSPFWWVVATVDGGLSTPDVYAEFDRIAEAVEAPEVPQPLLDAMASGDAGALADVVHNDLQAAACSLRPELLNTLAYGRSRGALAGLLSGSGPTCLFLAEGESHARELGSALADAPGVLRTEVVCGPVPGAQVVGPRAQVGAETNTDFVPKAAVTR